jgi:hypothetical protein
MRHASKDALDQLEPLLERIRRFSGLVERQRGVFYRRSRAYLHFHEDPAGLFADVRLTGDAFERLAVSTAADAEDLLVRIAQSLNTPSQL